MQVDLCGKWLVRCTVLVYLFSTYQVTLGSGIAASRVEEGPYQQNSYLHKVRQASRRPGVLSQEPPYVRLQVC
jgi:hypothetical protein